MTFRAEQFSEVTRQDKIETRIGDCAVYFLKLIGQQFSLIQENRIQNSKNYHLSE